MIVSSFTALVPRTLLVLQTKSMGNLHARPKQCELWFHTVVLNDSTRRLLMVSKRLHALVQRWHHRCGQSSADSENAAAEAHSREESSASTHTRAVALKVITSSWRHSKKTCNDEPLLRSWKPPWTESSRLQESLLRRTSEKGRCWLSSGGKCTSSAYRG